MRASASARRYALSTAPAASSARSSAKARHCAGSSTPSTRSSSTAGVGQLDQHATNAATIGACLSCMGDPRCSKRPPGRIERQLASPRWRVESPIRFPIATAPAPSRSSSPSVFNDRRERRLHPLHLGARNHAAQELHEVRVLGTPDTMYCQRYARRMVSRIACCSAAAEAPVAQAHEVAGVRGRLRAQDVVERSSTSSIRSSTRDRARRARACDPRDPIRSRR